MTETQDILPAETAGTEITRFNALKHGVLSRYTVLPWEDADEYRVLASSLADEHRPQGPTEEHLVEELASILWRKRRLRLAEAAAYQHGLEDATESYRGTAKAALVHLDSGKQIERVVDAIRATPEKTAEESRDLNEDESMTATAVAILDAGKPKAYEHAVAALLADTREWWEDVLLRDPEDFDEGETPFTPDADGLRRFIERDLRPGMFNDARNWKPSAHPGTGFRSVPRSRQAVAAGPLRGAPGPQVGTHPGHAAAAPGSAAGDGRIMIRFAKCPGPSSR